MIQGNSSLILKIFISPMRVYEYLGIESKLTKYYKERYKLHRDFKKTLRKILKDLRNDLVNCMLIPEVPIMCLIENRLKYLGVMEK